VKCKFVERRFGKSSLIVIGQANGIIEDYEEQGYSLSLRQLYYQFVARGFIPNTMKSYKRIGSIVNDGRMAGLIDWDAIKDRTRELEGNNHWDSPGSIIRSAISQYKIDRWEGAEYYVEVWVEKDALSDVISGPARSLDVNYFACKGYVSQSAMYEAAERIKGFHDERECIILHLGDHDPSGIDMTRDIQDRLSIFDARVEVKRIALNMDQIEQYSPPSNPAKTTDSRYKSYITEYGEESWELDALEPQVLDELVNSSVREFMDIDLFRERMVLEKKHKKSMSVMSEKLEEEMED